MSSVLETIAMANDELEAAKIDVQLELAGQLASHSRAPGTTSAGRPEYRDQRR